MFNQKQTQPKVVHAHRKVMGLALSALLLAGPVLQSASPVFATDTQATTTDGETEVTFGDLTEMIASAEAILSEYTTAGFPPYPSQAAFQEAINTAKTLTADSDPTEIQKSYNAIEATFEAVDNDYNNYVALQEKSHEIQGVIENGNVYSQASLDSMQAVIDTINKILATTYTTSEDLETAVENAVNQDYLVELQVTADIQNILNATQTVETLPSAEALKAEKEAAYTTILQYGGSQASGIATGPITDALNNLQSIYDTYQKELAAKNALQAANDAATTVLSDGKTYPDEVIQAIKNAVAAGQTKVTDVTWGADQSEAYITAANAAAKAINDAVAEAKAITEPGQPSTPGPNLPNEINPNTVSLKQLRHSVVHTERIGMIQPDLTGGPALFRALAATKLVLAKNGVGYSQQEVDLLTDVLNKAYGQYVAGSTTGIQYADGIGQIFTKGQGVKLYNHPAGMPVLTPKDENQTLADQSAWKVFRKVILPDGSAWYEVGQNQWIQADYLLLEKNQVATISKETGATLWALNQKQVQDTGRQLDLNTPWRSFGQMWIKDQKYLNLGGNQWVNAKDVTVDA